MSDAGPNFYLGVHQVHWLERTDVPLFISRRRLLGRKRYPRALGRWALDSGGYTELSMNGAWGMTATDYAAFVREARAEVGSLDWAAIMDWMCDPDLLARTGLSIAQHQTRTIISLLTLRSKAPDLPWAPVLQGWSAEDYLRHADDYESAGIALDREPIVGVGSLVTRQGSGEAEAIVHRLAARGLRLHGFGVKIRGLGRMWADLASADSMAWSYDARRADPMPGHTHKSCANCLDYALRWRDRVISTCSAPRSRQMWLL